MSTDTENPCQMNKYQSPSPNLEGSYLNDPPPRLNALGCHETSKDTETETIGELLGQSLVAGDVITLSGPLGSGKTTFAKGLARGLGITEDITSPTYSLVSQYHGRRLIFYHVDLYRISSHNQYMSLALDEILYGPWVTAVEWPEHASPLITDSIHTTFSVLPNGSHKIYIGMTK